MEAHGILIVAAGFASGLLAIPLDPPNATPGFANQQVQVQRERLPLCGKCFIPSIFSKSGIGTAHAVAQARVTYEDAREHCENWSMADHPDCDKQARESVEAESGKIYTASADCERGKLTIADGESFVYAGLWPGGSPKGSPGYFLKGKTRWYWGARSGKDTGKTVTMDGPTSAPMVDATSTILCPRGIGTVRKR